MLFDHFYSDPHFWHSSILRLAERDFESIEHMNAELIARYNRYVGDDHVVLWLGDVAFGGHKLLADILAQMTGYKVLVPGNHDSSRSERALLRAGFDAVVPNVRIMMAGRSVLCSHYPYVDGWRPNQKVKGPEPERRKGEVLVHGHTHQKIKRRGNMVHIGVDSWDYRPPSWSEVEALVAEV